MRNLILGSLLVGAATTAQAQFSPSEHGRFLKDEATAFVLENARLIDGSGGPAVEGVTVMIDQGRITYVGKDAPAPPENAKHINLAGHTILPGLVMMHEHINYFSGAEVWDSHPRSVPKLLLAAGVTSARTAGAEAPQIDLNLKRRIDEGLSVGPRLFVTGAYLNGEDSPFLGDNIVRNAEEAAALTRFWADRGATSVKVYSMISAEALRGAVEEANRKGIHVAGHLGEIGCEEAADAGIHTIEHSLSSCLKDLGVDPTKLAEFRYEDHKEAAGRLIKKLVARGVVLVATPPATETYEPSEDELASLSPQQLERYQLLVSQRPPWLPPLSVVEVVNDAHRKFERDFVAAGGRLLLGADASDFGKVPGYANHSAIIALVKAGFEPVHVIRFASSNAAEFLGQSDNFGTVSPGKAADLLVVAGAPDKQIEDIRRVEYVFKDGQAYDSAKLREAAKGQIGLH